MNVRVLDWIHQATGVIAGAGILLLMTGVVADVVVRTLAGFAVPGVVDYSEVLIVLCAFIALGYAQRDGAHVVVDTLIHYLKPGGVAVLSGIVILATVPLLLWLSWETAELAIQSYQRGEFRFGIYEVKLWPARAMLPLGLVLWAIEILRENLTTIARVRSGQYQAGSSHV
jgi:TRAP-type mannitol/chloroaromatic compound transport system permease small subunit